MPKTIRLKMNASSGKIDLQCSEEFYEDAMSKCIEIVTVFSEKKRQLKGKTADTKIFTSNTEEIEVETPPNAETSKKPTKTRSRSGKPPNYTKVDLNLSDDQKREFKEFFELKAPKTQNEIVCVVTSKLKEFLDQDNFSVDEVFSGIRLIGAIQTPKNLKAVFANIESQGIGIFTDGKLNANFATDDFVKLKLPKKKEA